MDKLDAEINKLEDELRGLREREAQVEAGLKVLKQARGILRGEGDVAIERRLSIPDAVEEILRARGPTHISDLLVELKGTYNMDAARETVTTSIGRYISQKRRFKRVGPNKFALLEKR
jgi:predicted  nucleic acid-binding Zn-ribbon protein